MARTTPKGKSQPRPKPEKREPSQSPNLALIIFLSLSMVINITLGVFYYLDKENVAKARSAETTAKSAETQAKADYALLRDFFLTKFRSVVGDPQLKPEEISEMTAKNEAALRLAEASFPWYKEMMLRVAGDPGKQGEARDGEIGPMKDKSKPGFVGEEPSSTFSIKIAKLRGETNSLRQQLRAKEEDLKNVAAEFEGYKKDWNPQKVEDSLKAQAARMTDDQKKRVDEKDVVIEEYKKRLTDLERQAATELKKEKDRYEADIAAKERAFKDRVKELELQVKEELQKLQVSQTVTMNEPRGQVVRVEPKGDQIHINIGSNARLQPKVPFVVYGRGPAGSARPVPKAKIEVIQTTGPETALARVLEVRRVDAPFDPNTSEDYATDRANWVNDPRNFWTARNPIQQGDLLFNPAWDPRRQVRVYLAGPFDLDGDGRDDVREVERLLQSYGVKVDGYLDPNTNYGPTGMLQYRTDFVVIGDVPEVLADAKGGAEPKRAQGNEMLTQIGKITQEAREKGVEVIGWKRFFARMGYSPSRLPTNASGSGVGGGQVRIR